MYKYKIGDILIFTSQSKNCGRLVKVVNRTTNSNIDPQLIVVPVDGLGDIKTITGDMRHRAAISRHASHLITLYARGNLIILNSYKLHHSLYKNSYNKNTGNTTTLQPPDFKRYLQDKALKQRRHDNKRICRDLKKKEDRK